MGIDYIALAIPLFFVGIGIELWAARARRRSVYRFDDAVTDMSCGIGQQMLKLFTGAALLAGYGWLHERYTFVRFPSGSGWPWLIALVGVDLLYYWWHRLSHEVNFLWAAHVVHHQSEDYNLAVALRQSVLTDITSWPFYLPLAFLGVPLLAFAVMRSLSTLYQFWIHTELVGKLGPLERVINTPSHHRVHHAINPRYLDKNYGATFMLWDQLFGTFAVEREAAVYGTVKPLASFNPLWAQVEYLVGLARTAWRAPRPVDKLLVWLKPPTWHPAGMAGYPGGFPRSPDEGGLPAEVSPGTYRKYDPGPAPAVTRYVAVQLVLTVVITFLVMLFAHQLPLPVLAATATLVGLTTLSWGGLFESRRWARPLELGRLVLVAAAVVALWPEGPWRSPAAAGAVALAAAMGTWLLVERRRMTQPV